nr:ABC transporter permease subunit [Paenibacillus aceris]
MFLPVIVYFVIFKYGPMLGLIVAFKDYNFRDGIFGSPWAGMKYFQMLGEAPQTFQIVRNTLLLSLLSIFGGFAFPVALAVMINEVRKAWFKRIVQTLIYLPHFFSWVIVGGIFVTIFSQQSGVVNHVLNAMTHNAYPFLYKPVSWVAIFIGAGIWKEAGFTAIIYLAALMNIDPSLYEASEIDGAGKWKQIWHITLPGLQPTMVLMLILAMGHVLDVGFDQVYVLQNETVSDIAEVISTYIYRVGLQGNQISLTTALGLFESLVAFILVILTNAIARKFNKELF